MAMTFFYALIFTWECRPLRQATKLRRRCSLGTRCRCLWHIHDDGDMGRRRVHQRHGRVGRSRRIGMDAGSLGVRREPHHRRLRLRQTGAAPATPPPCSIRWRIDSEHGWRACSTCQQLLGELFWTASILTALGTTFALILDIHFGAAIVVGAVVGITYTSIGGLGRSPRRTSCNSGSSCSGSPPRCSSSSPTTASPASSRGIARQWARRRSFPQPAWGNRYYKWWDTALLLIFGGIPWHVYFQRVLASKDEATAKRLSIGAGVLCSSPPCRRWSPAWFHDRLASRRGRRPRGCVGRRVRMC